MKHGQTIEQVKSTVSGLEVSPSKNAPNSSPTYTKMGGKGGKKGSGGGSFKPAS